WTGEEDAAPWDTPPDVGFDSHPVARAIVPPEGRVRGGGALVLDPAENNSYKAMNRAWTEGAQVSFAPGTAGAGGVAGASGSWVITGLSSGARDALVRDLRLQASGGSPSATTVPRPRVGVYRPWNASMDEGWTRWVLERYGFAFTSLYNPDVLAGDLGDRYDVIVIADMRARSILEGFGVGTVPPRYAGGLGAEGVRELDAFVRAGGTLVTINGSSGFAVEQLHLPVRDVTQGLERDEFSLSGSILEMEVDPSHPVMSGLLPRAKIMVGSSPVFTTEEGFEGRVLAKYPKEGSPLLSGYLLGEEHLKGYAAALEVKHGEGRVILLGLRPQWRGQPFGSFKILFNAALYSQRVASMTPGNPGFWTAPEEGEEDPGSEPGQGRGPGRGGM
ncbi:MAG: M14 family metallopeptidase, partial [Longimicrobiales bacterium]